MAGQVKKKRVNKYNTNIQFSIIGTNAAGLKANQNNLINNLKVFNNPCCVTIQETN